MRHHLVAAVAALLLAQPTLAQNQIRDPQPLSLSQTETPRNPQTTTQITVENRMGQGVVIFALYVSPSTHPTWGDDRLGDHVLLPGRITRIAIQGDCAHQDVRILVLHTDSRGRGPTGEIVRRSLNICSGLRLSPDLPWRVELPT